MTAYMGFMSRVRAGFRLQGYEEGAEPVYEFCTMVLDTPDLFSRDVVGSHFQQADWAIGYAHYYIDKRFKTAKDTPKEFLVPWDVAVVRDEDFILEWLKYHGGLQEIDAARCARWYEHCQKNGVTAPIDFSDRSVWVGLFDVA